MKLYAFDEVTDQLQLLPLAARRALDHAGLKLSRAAWTGLPLATREALVRSGSEATVSPERVTALAAAATPAAEVIAPVGDPPADAPPPELAGVVGKPIDPGLWASLSPLDRYALVKAARSSRPERLAAAYDEIVVARSDAGDVRRRG